ncbi:hypothetical protein T310_6727, partial [Rasamsonia emersonii CBS 393.64]
PDQACGAKTTCLNCVRLGSCFATIVSQSFRPYMAAEEVTDKSENAILTPPSSAKSRRRVSKLAIRVLWEVRLIPMTLLSNPPDPYTALYQT